MTPEQIRADRKLSKAGPRFQFVPGTGFMGSETTAFTPSGEAWHRRVLRLVDLEDAYLALTDRVAQLEAALSAISQMHDGNPPMPLADMPDVEYARRVMRTMRQEARTALTGEKP